MSGHSPTRRRVILGAAALTALPWSVLTAEAKETSANPKIATYSVNITNESGDLIGRFQGMVYRKKAPLPL